MEEIEVKWIHAMQVWWSWFWRTMVWVLPVSFIIGVIVGVMFNVLDLSMYDNIYLIQMFGGAIGIYFSIKVMKKVLNKTFKGYRIALIKVDSSTEIDA
ncbi:hypothetical protein [Flocculibacter collagenilyticus]|uniref:hypothetical protein n=1 Tax=Flocculibacter collagenilyticus TaxID=2744479 RepID=UPI0018F5B25C|nr:hypothetical protein [Flocculibacter collagenilyticus]